MSNNEALNRTAASFKALSNPHRLALFQRLMSCCTPGTACSTEEMGGCCVGELGAGMDIAPSTLSHHLKELNRAGLVHMERQGKTIQCRVEPGALTELLGFLAQTSETTGDKT